MMNIKDKLDEYLEFDSKYLFTRHDSIYYYGGYNKLIRIFGGSIRDILAGQPINDIDILCGSQSLDFLNKTLEFMGYHYIESLIHKELSSLYKDIKVINEPHTWVKNKKVIQVIRPSMYAFNSNMPLNERLYKTGFIDLISNVDISCCGLSYDGQNLYQNYPNAIIHSQNKVFFVNPKAKMYSSNRIYQRIEKLCSRGWTRIEDFSDERNAVIDNILNINDSIDFINEVSINPVDQIL